MRTHGNGARVKSTVFVSTRAAVIGRATVGRTGKMVPQAVRVSFRGRLSWRLLSFRSGHSRDWHIADNPAAPAFVRYWRVVSTDRRNTLSYREKMECDDGSEISSLFYRSREDGVMGLLATGSGDQYTFIG